MSQLQQAIASGQVSAAQIEAHRAAGELPIEMFEPTPETVLYAEKTRSHNLIKNGKEQTLREAIDGATDPQAHVWCKVADVRAALLDAERLDWLTRHVGGDELRRNGIVWPAWSSENARNAIDAAIKGAQS